MFLFLRLLLAHLVADFPLQTNAVFRLKIQGLGGVLFHAAIFGVTAFFLGITYAGELSFLVFLLVLVALHVLEDRFKILFIDKNQMDNVWIFLLDQAVHIGVLLPVFFIPALSVPRPLSIPYLGAVYNDDRTILYLIGLTVAAFGGSIFLYYLKKTLVDERIGYQRDYDGMLERLLLVFIFILKEPWFFGAVPVVVAARVGIYFLDARHRAAGFDIILRQEQPILLDRRIKFKGDVAVDLLGSPLLAVTVGALLMSL